MNDFFTTEGLRKAIHGEIRTRINEIITEEVEEARKRMEKRIRDDADKMALRVLDFYNVRMNEHNIVITVEKPGVKYD